MSKSAPLYTGAPNPSQEAMDEYIAELERKYAESHQTEKAEA